MSRILYAPWLASSQTCIPTHMLMCSLSRACITPGTAAMQRTGVAHHAAARAARLHLWCGVDHGRTAWRTMHLSPAPPGGTRRWGASPSQYHLWNASPGLVPQPSVACWRGWDACVRRVRQRHLLPAPAVHLRAWDGRCRPTGMCRAVRPVGLGPRRAPSRRAPPLPVPLDLPRWPGRQGRGTRVRQRSATVRTATPSHCPTR